MSFFIQDAYAAGGPAPQGGDQFITIIIFVVLIAFFWFFLIRPQQKRQKELQQMIAAIAKGDEVVTNGGILGRVKDLGDQFISLEIAQGVEIRVQKQAVSRDHAQGHPQKSLKSLTVFPDSSHAEPLSGCGKTCMVILVTVLGILLALPNLYGDDPAVQVSENNASTDQRTSSKWNRR